MATPRRIFAKSALGTLLAAILSVLAGAGTAEAGGACPNVRLDRAPGPAAHLTIRNQGQVRICYANTAVDLIDAWRSAAESKRGGRLAHSSALEAALRIKERDQGREGGRAPAGETSGAGALDLGNTCRVVEFLRRAGSCDTRLLPQRLRGGARLKQRLNDLLSFKRAFREMGPSELGREVVAGALYDYLTHDLRIPERSLPPRQKLAEILAEPSPLSYLRRLATSQCSRHQRIDLDGVPACADIGKSAFGIGRIMDSIKARLSARENPQPVAIHFCSQVLTVGRSYAGAAGAVPDAGCDRHSALVIGSRPHEGRCEFLVRNSWGKSCAPYAKDWRCTGGDVWVDEAALERNVYRFSYLQ